ncbi:hypothetical protein ABIC10_008163 [Bradyrhizobium sp. S3.2.12]
MMKTSGNYRPNPTRPHTLFESETADPDSKQPGSSRTPYMILRCLKTALQSMRR